MEFTLSSFTGPLDLLLHLISKARIEPSEIFVSEITEQYIAIMEQTEQLDMDQASDFLSMAATLLYIKSRSMLPDRTLTVPELDEEGRTPEQQLIWRLNEYKRFKEVTEQLGQLERAAAMNVYRLPGELSERDHDLEFTNASVTALFGAYLKAMERFGNTLENLPIEIAADTFSVKGQTSYILEQLSGRKKVGFFEILGERPTRSKLTATFLALLELIHSGTIRFSQNELYGEIFLTMKKGKTV